MTDSEDGAATVLNIMQILWQRSIMLYMLTISLLLLLYIHTYIGYIELRGFNTTVAGMGIPLSKWRSPGAVLLLMVA